VSQTDLNGNDTIEQAEVQTVPRSLLNKALVAQGVFDAKFLLPFAPAAPRFFAIPGDNQVTVVWQPSASEAAGDPYYAVASAPLTAGGGANPLYDPNYRHFDVEGYRIYRGRTTGQLELIAQFDYAGTEMIDFTGGFDYGSGCAPELVTDTVGTRDTLARPPGCPVAFDITPPFTGPTVSHPLVGDVIQIPAGGRVQLRDSTQVLIIHSDTAVTGGGSGNPALTDNGVGFAFTDRSVRNGFRYYYAVTAFDVNSVRSGFTSLESAPSPTPVLPRASSGQEQVGTLANLQLLNAAGNPLTIGAVPTINATTGIFSGPHPPTDGVALGLVAFLPEVLGTGSVTLTIDSVVPGSALTNIRAATYYVRGQGAGPAVSLAIPIVQDAFSTDVSVTAGFQATTIDATKAARYGGDASFALFGSASVSVPGTWRITGWGRGDANADPANSAFN